MKNSEIYLMPKSNATLTQSGLLAVMLRRQFPKGSKLAQRFPITLPWPLTHGVTASGRDRRGFGKTVRLRP